MSVVVEVYRQTIANLTTWPRNALRFARFARLVRPVGPPPPPYIRCAGCHTSGRKDQLVPDPDQYATKKGVTPAGDVVGNAAAVPAKAPDPIVVNVARLNLDPGAEAARLSDEEAKRKKDGTAVKLIDAAPVWCPSCRAWYHAIGCYSTHPIP